jgi:Protein of unknown function (DUF998)
MADGAPVSDDRSRIALDVHPADQGIAGPRDEQPAAFRAQASEELVSDRCDVGDADRKEWEPDGPSGVADQDPAVDKFPSQARGDLFRAGYLAHQRINMLAHPGILSGRSVKLQVPSASAPNNTNQGPGCILASRRLECRCVADAAPSKRGLRAADGESLAGRALSARHRSGCWSCAVSAVTVVVVRGVPWWGVVSSAAAPVLMVAGWTVAAGLQPRSFDPVAQPVSVLAAPGAADRWVMTLTFLVVGACYVVTGLALRPARAPGRLILIAAAVAGILVAANPEQPGTSFPLPHMIWAAAGCAALVAWPAGAWRRGPSAPWGLRPAVSAAAVTVLVALLAWFGAELITRGGQAGLAERVFGAAQALWPLAVVVSCRRAARTRTRPSLIPGLNRSGPPSAVDA